jgi:hypothetical protein
MKQISAEWSTVYVESEDGNQPTMSCIRSGKNLEVENAIYVPQRRKERVVLKGTGDRLGRREFIHQLFEAPCDAVEGELVFRLDYKNDTNTIP